MARSETYNKWLEAGYDIFALEGPEGILVEKIARALNLNKSGFYHYFGDLENYYKRLIKYHEQLHDHFVQEVPACQKLNPDFLNLIMKYKKELMFQMQLVKNKHNPIFGEAYKVQYDKTTVVLYDIWCHHITIHQNPELSIQYFNMVRDMFYARVTWDNLTFDYLLGLSDEIYHTATKFLNEKERLQGDKSESN